MFEKARLVVGVAAVLFLGYKGLVGLSTQKSVPEEAYEDESPSKQKRKVSKRTESVGRAPASPQANSSLYKSPMYQETAKNDDLFTPPASEDTPTASEGDGKAADATSFGSEEDGPPIPFAPGSGRRAASAPSQSPTPAKPVTSRTMTSFGGGGGFIPNLPGSTGGAAGGSSGGGGEDPTVPVCSASVGGGTYSTPQTVTLTCSTSADIKYCLSENTCCDPQNALAYTSPITVGTGPGTFCLSFIGTTEDGVDSQVKEITYKINPAAPNIQMAQTKIYYQTTELEGKLSLTSSDFGKATFSMGVVNLKSHDPGVTGLDLDCDEIVETSGSLPAPVPIMLMTDTDISGFSPSSQIDVFLDTTNLFYGKNYLTSYVKNGRFANAPYSCSHNLVTLEDFEFYQFTPTHGDPGTNDVREFSGGFTHMGFFEEETTVFRGPAGVASENVSDQELRVGMFGVFY